MHRLLKRKQVLSILLCAPIGALSAQEFDASRQSTISYEIALNRAIDTDPELRGFEARVEAAEGQVEQASLRPNPVVGADIENFFGSGDYRDVQGVELTLGVAQLIETAGKRAKRTELARTLRDNVAWDRELRLAAVETAVRSAFVDVLLAQKWLDLRGEQLNLARRSEAETARLVDAARSTQVELTRAGLAVQQQEFALKQARLALNAARGRLAALWGDSPSTEFKVTGSVELEAQLPELAQLVAILPQSAFLARYDGNRRIQEASLTLEEARATPDVEVFGGGRYFNEGSGDAAFVLGIAIPWPLFDKNQGNIRTARAKLRSVDYEREATRRQLIIKLTDAYQELAAASEEARSVQTGLRPAAERSMAETEEGFERGQFTLLSVLESRATLFEISEIYLDAVTRYTVAQARIEMLTRPAKPIH
ncbi:MAG: TolC family protein [Opitutaceae bacterium]